jgi:hypothetical protein
LLAQRSFPVATGFLYPIEHSSRQIYRTLATLNNIAISRTHGKQEIGRQIHRTLTTLE